MMLTVFRNSAVLLFPDVNVKGLIKILIALLLILPAVGKAQQVQDSLSFSKRYFKSPSVISLFGKELNTYSSRTELNFKKTVNGLFFGVSEKYFTTLIKSAINHLKDENNFRAFGELKIAGFLSQGIMLNSTVYSDDRKLNINNASNGVSDTERMCHKV